MRRRRTQRAELELLYAHLETLVANAPIGLGLWDLEFRYLRLNKALAELNGLPVESHLGKTVAEVLPDLWRTLEPLWRRVVDTGEPLLDVEVTGETRRDPGVPHIYLASYYPVRSPSGDALGLGAVVTDVTGRVEAERERERLLEADRRAQEALRESEERQRLAVDAAELGMWFWDLREDRLEWTPRCREMFGLSPEDTVTYSRFLRALHPDDRARTDAAVRRTLDEHVPFDVEYRTVWPDGSVHWIAAKGHSFIDGRTDAVRMLGVVNDITKRKRAAERADRLHNMTSALAGASSVDDVGQAIVDHAAPAIEAQTGLVILRSEGGDTLHVVAKAGFDTLRAGARLEIPVSTNQPIAAAVRSGRPVFVHSADERPDRLEGQVWLPSGIAYGSGAALPLLVQGRVIGALALTFSSRQPFDDDERTFLLTLAGQCAQALERARLFDLERRARSDAEAAERHLRQILDVLPVGLLIVDRGGQVTHSNAAAESILGRDLVGEHVPLEDDEAFSLYGVRDAGGAPLSSRDLPMQRALLDGEVVHAMQHEQRHFSSGRAVLLLANAAPLRDAEGTVVGAVSAFQDISSIRELERSKDAFLAAVSHDLKNPLAGIHGQAQLLQRRLDSPDPLDRDRLRDGAHQIESAAGRLAVMVEMLLDIARMQAGNELELERRQTDLVALALETIADYQARSPGHILVVEATQAAVVGRWDPARLGRVLENLVSNAVKYSRHGTRVRLGIHVEKEGNGRWAVLTITDEGIGIRADDLPSIFEPFYRGRNVPDRIRGTGLGMAASRQIVEQHGGTMGVESAEGKGTTVTVRLPLPGDS